MCGLQELSRLNPCLEKYQTHLSLHICPIDIDYKTTTAFLIKGPVQKIYVVISSMQQMLSVYVD